MPAVGQFLSLSVRKALRTAHIASQVDRGVLFGLREAGAFVRGIARQSIGRSATPSAPGKPPHSRTGRLKNAIIYAVDPAAESVVVGPAASVLGRIGGTHEWGGTEPVRRVSARRRTNNWNLTTGGHGPIRLGDGGLAFAKLNTGAQVARSLRIVEQYGDAAFAASESGARVSGARGVRRYPARPFMSLALSRAMPRLPSMLARRTMADRR